MGHSIAILQDSQQNVLCANIGVVKFRCLLSSHFQNTFHTLGVGKGTDITHIGCSRNKRFLNRVNHGGYVDLRAVKNGDGKTLPKFQQAEQHMFRANVVVVKSQRFPASKVDHLLSSWCKVIHNYFVVERFLEENRAARRPLITSPRRTSSSVG